MQVIRKHLRTIVIATVCAAAGAGISLIASAGAHPAHGPRSAARALPGRFGARAGLLGRGLRRRAVSGQLIVVTPHGFRTLKFDRGIVQSVSGQQLTLVEGMTAGPSRTVVLTIPADARVRDNRRQATLSQLSAGQRAVVIQRPRRTLVIARTAGAGRRTP